MKNQPPLSARPSPQAPFLKDSIRDMIRLQRGYPVPDELFWEAFNTRVLLNEPIDVVAFVRSQTGFSVRI